MNFGRFRHRLYIASPEIIERNSIDVEEIVATSKGIWADVSPLSASARINQGRETGLLTHSVTTWYRTDIETGTLLLFGDRVLRVENPPRDNKTEHKTIFVDCIEIKTINVGSKR